MGQNVAKKPARKPKPRPKKYICPELNCEKAYSRPCLLEQHLRSHADERPFVCTHPDCGKAFLRDSHLKTHMLSHSVEKPLYCSYCGKGFNTNQHLNRHERTHVPSIKCTYEGCSAAFRRNSQLRRHISEFHTFRKQFVCPSCPREFDVKSRLDTHFAKCHSGASVNSTPTGSHLSTPTPVGTVGHQAYICGNEGCVEKFDSWPDLQAHIKFTHKRVICTLCGKLFDSSETLDMHVKEHELENSHLMTQEWHCREPQCESSPIPLSFREKDSLISHYQQYHGFVPESLQVQVQTPASVDCLPPLSSITDQHKQQQQQFLHTIPQQQPLPHLSYNLPYSHQQQQQQLPTVREPLYKQPSIIDRLAGSGYDAHRRIECPVDGCGYRFAREYDMKRHAKAVHPLISIDELVAASRVSSESPSLVNTNLQTDSNQFNAAVPKFKFYMPPANLTPHSDLSPASVTHPSSSSSSPASFQLKHEDLEVPSPLDQQQQLPSLSQYHQHQAQPTHPHHPSNALPSFDPALNVVPHGSPNGFDYLSHDLALGGFSSVPLSHDLLNESTSTSTPTSNGVHASSHHPSYYQGSQSYAHPQPLQPQHQAQQPHQQRGEFERIDPMIVNGSV